MNAFVYTNFETRWNIIFLQYFFNPSFNTKPIYLFFSFHRIYLAFRNTKFQRFSKILFISLPNLYQRYGKPVVSVLNFDDCLKLESPPYILFTSNFQHVYTAINFVNEDSELNVVREISEPCYFLPELASGVYLQLSCIWLLYTCIYMLVGFFKANNNNLLCCVLFQYCLLLLLLLLERILDVYLFTVAPSDSYWSHTFLTAISIYTETNCSRCSTHPQSYILY